MATLKQIQNRAALATLSEESASEQSVATARANRWARALADAYKVDGEPLCPPTTTAAQFVVDGGRATVAATHAAAQVAVIDAALALFDAEVA